MKKINYGLNMLTLLLVLLFSCMATAQEVNINTADAETIAASLKGIGLSKAQAIVVWRENNGHFSDLNSLQQVKGIGSKTVEKNKKDIQF